MKISYVQVSAETFKKIIVRVVALGGHYANNIDVKQSYEAFDCFTSTDQLSGFAVSKKTRELVNVFSLEKGRGRELLEVATSTFSDLKLDCFDGKLTSLYSEAGFQEISRDKNWTAGEPDVVFMQFNKER